MTTFVRVLALLLVIALAPAPSSATDKKKGCWVGPDARPLGKQIALINFNGTPRKLKDLKKDMGPDSFSFNNVGSIKIQTEWIHLNEPHLQRTLVYAPDGNLFKSYATSFDPTRKGEVKEKSFVPDVEVDFPIAGTAVKQYRMSGTWCVVVFLDSYPDPVAERGFILTTP